MEAVDHVAQDYHYHDLMTDHLDAKHGITHKNQMLLIEIGKPSRKSLVWIPYSQVSKNGSYFSKHLQLGIAMVRLFPMEVLLDPERLRMTYNQLVKLLRRLAGQRPMV